MAALEVATRLDTLTPNYLTVSPDGKIGATFSGSIEAQGIVLPAGTGFSSTPPKVDRIEWDRASDGAAVATIYGWSNAAGHTEGVSVSAAAAEVGGATNTSLNAYDDLGALQAALGVTQQSRGAGQVFASVTGAGGRLILDSSGNANFVQTPATGAYRLQALSGVCTWNGGGFASPLTPVAFTAGPASSVWAVAGQLGNNGFYCACQYVALTASTGEVSMSTTNGAVPPNGHTEQFFVFVLTA